MISQSTKKWKKRVTELESSLGVARKKMSAYREDMIKAEAKLERYEADERRVQDGAAMEHREMKSQVEWLRSLIERIVIDPEVFKQEVTREVRMQELRERQYRLERKDREMRDREYRRHEEEMDKINPSKRASELNPSLRKNLY